MDNATRQDAKTRLTPREALIEAGDELYAAFVDKICPSCSLPHKTKGQVEALAAYAKASNNFRTAPPKPAPDAKLATLLRNAALFLELGARYAPNEAVSDRSAVTGEMLKTRGLADVMKSIAAECAAVDAIKEQHKETKLS